MKATSAGRINVFLCCVVILAGLITYRLFVLSYVRHAVYSKTAKAQNESISNVLIRGNIYVRASAHADSDLMLVATNKKFGVAYMIPSDVKTNNGQELANHLALILDIDAAPTHNLIQSQSKNYKVLARKLSTEQIDQIKALGVKGVGIQYESDRYYPADQLAASVLGYFGHSSQGRSGQYGIEAYYNKELTGNKEKGSVARPADLVLTIDKDIQIYVEDKLQELIKKWNAAQGTIIVQEPMTGKILAMADVPSFNPNNYQDSKPEYFLNRGLQQEFEPGSSFKPITMAMGLDLNKINPDTTFTDQGSVSIAGFTIKNFNESSFGVQTMTEVLEKSINTGAIHVENLVGDENFLNYSINFGFGQKTGIDLPGEISANITNLYSRQRIHYFTASFGQGLTVTPIQIINAYSVIANGGKLMKPYVVEKMITEGGSTVEINPELVSIPISEKTASRLTSMLVSAVSKGFDKARIDGYDVAGKTGTAQIADGKGGYLKDEFIHSFVGFAPAYNPKFVILIKLDRPQGIRFAADSLSPTFRDITSFLLNYYNLPPNR